LFFTVGELFYYEIFRDLSDGSTSAGCGGGVYSYACVLFDVGGYREGRGSRGIKEIWLNNSSISNSLFFS